MQPGDIEEDKLTVLHDVRILRFEVPASEVRTIYTVYVEGVFKSGYGLRTLAEDKEGGPLPLENLDNQVQVESNGVFRGFISFKHKGPEAVIKVLPSFDHFQIIKHASSPRLKCTSLALKQRDDRLMGLSYAIAGLKKNSPTEQKYPDDLPDAWLARAAWDSVVPSSPIETLVIYHGNCADGFTAAWIAYTALDGRRAVSFHAATYGEEAPDCSGKDVFILDFSYKRKVMTEIAAVANTVVVLDHHVTAKKDLAGLNEMVDNTTVIFDMHKSGAVLAWEYFFPQELTPKLVRYVQDRDLWNFQMPGTKDFTAGLFSYEYTFENWDYAANNVDQIIEEGKILRRKHDKDIAELIAKNENRRILFRGFDIPVINVPYMMGSDACSILCENEPFAVYYYDSGDTRYFGLRSSPDGGEDVSKIAELFGGGGHKHAAGFQIASVYSLLVFAR